MYAIQQEEFLPVVRHHYPEFSDDGWKVTNVSVELNELVDLDFIDKALTVEKEASRKAIDSAVEELVIKHRPPKQWIFVRLENAAQKKPVLLIIPTLDCPITFKKTML